MLRPLTSNRKNTTILIKITFNHCLRFSPQFSRSRKQFESEMTGKLNEIKLSASCLSLLEQELNTWLSTRSLRNNDIINDRTCLCLNQFSSTSMAHKYQNYQLPHFCILISQLKFVNFSRSSEIVLHSSP